ncbi:MAG TPA: hypothetical protein VK837_11030 [Longimicrobiales bacterium]|nr:hypothetical protein [Longimicrobiales bacterium]
MPQIDPDLITLVYPLRGLLTGLGVFAFLFIWTTVEVRRHNARVKHPFRTVLRHVVLGALVGLLVAIDTWSLLGSLRWPVAITLLAIVALAIFTALGRRLWAPRQKDPQHPE